MKAIKYILITAAAFMALSCEDILETKTINEFDETDVWRIPALAEGTLLTAYRAIPDRFDTFDGNFLDAATDNAVTNNYTSSVYRLANGTLSRQNNPIDNWSDCYDQLQTIHLFMEKGLGEGIVYDKTSEENDVKIKTRLRGECFFLRALWHFYLLQRYGGRDEGGEALGIPLTDHFITEEEAKHPENFVRASYEDCAKSIIRDCDSAMLLLPAVYTGADVVTGTSKVGRANSMSARVLKSRAALYAASPAYRPDDVTTITGMGQFTVSDDASYAENWERAALMSDTIIRTAGFGNFSALTQANLISTGNTPADFVFRFYFNANGIETRHFPPYYYGEAQTTPSHNLVEAFPSKTGGFPTTDSRSLYDPADPYAMARDNRFALNIYYHGRTFATNSGAIDVSYGGKDSPSYSPNATRTGYYLSKFLSKKDGMLTPTPDKSNDGHYTPVMRKSEVFYNFAEASNEAWGPTVKGPGCQYSAYEVMKTIRAAYGIAPDTWLEECAADKDMFRELVQSERRLEFAFEGQRFFDMRRWLLELDEPVRGVQVTNDNGAYSYRVVEVERHRYGQVHHYYLPLPYQELMKNPNLKNNAGWDNN